MNLVIATFFGIAALIAPLQMKNNDIVSLVVRLIECLAMISIPAATCIALYNNKNLYIRISKILNYLMLLSMGLVFIAGFLEEGSVSMIAVAVVYVSISLINLRTLRFIAKSNKFDFPIKDPTA